MNLLIEGGTSGMGERPRAIELMRRVLEVRPCGLMTDIDGTISRVAAHPDLATVEPEAREALKELVSRVDLVAAITGRSASDAYSLVSVEGIIYSGNHGMEIWRAGSIEQSPLAKQHVPQVRELVARLQSEIAIEGVYFEDKDLTASIHVREAPDPERAERKILAHAEPIAAELDLRITRGRMVIEIRPPIELNKGTSVESLIDAHGLRGALYLGDDVTDVDAFVALRDRRARTGDPFFGIGVSSPETPDVVEENADAVVEGVDGVVEFLREAGKFSVPHQW